MTDWAGLFPEEIKEKLLAMGESGYRAQQIFAWFSKGVEFSGMTNLPAALRDALQKDGDFPVDVVEEKTSADGDTVKFLFSFYDGNLVEGVLLRYHHGNTLCISTQVGCLMGCAFCASTLGGKARDVTAGEMLGMAALVNAKFARDGRRGVTNIVLMGSGEPLDNYEQVVKFLRLVSHPKGMGISPRNISLSTCGLVEGIDRLAGEGLPVTLSLSLHAPNDDIRRLIMPIAKRYSIRDTVAAAKRYAETTGRRVIVEYTLIAGLNDRREHALALAGLLRGLNGHVNLIPLNPVAERPDLLPPRAADVHMFSKALAQAGVDNTVRRALGEDIQGACGQLRRKHMEDV